MASSLPEELKTFAELYPDQEARLQLHYYFVHRFLAWYVHDNPFHFVMHDAMEPTKFIQARLAVQAHHFLGPSSPPAHRLFRRATDLEAWTEEVAGHPGLFIQMPMPENSGHAFFAAAVLLVRTKAFDTMAESVQQYVSSKGVSPIVADIDSVRKGRARFFTLERTMNFEGEQALKMGRLCEWTAEREHLNSGLAVPVTRAEFVETVARACQQGDHIPAVASHTSGDNPFLPHCFKPAMQPQSPATAVHSSLL